MVTTNKYEKMKDEKGNIVGLAMILINPENKILIGKRREYVLDVNGKLCFPGGHLENWESKLVGTLRETEEETGLTPDDYGLIDLEPFADIPHIGDDGNPYVTFFYRANYNSRNRPIVMEPEKHAWWNFYSWEEIKKAEDELFRPLIELIKLNRNPIE